MQLTLLKAKLHRVTVTEADLDYEGSCAIDDDLLQAAGILPYEQVAIYNIANGHRFTTYAIRAEAGSGVISVNGAAAHLGSPGELLIICAYARMEAAEAEGFRPALVYVDGANRITGSKNAIPVQAA